MKLRSLSTGAAAAIAATALLTGVAFAASNATDITDNDGADHGTAMAKLARTTTTTGEAKGDVISAAAKANAEANDNDAKDATDTDAEEAKDEDAKDEDADTADNDETDADSHGDTISALARATEAGPGHGTTVSRAARSGSTDTRNDGKGSPTSTDARKGHGSH